MSDLIDDPAPGQNAPEFSVSEISGAIKRTLESQFGRIRVRGEVGRVVKARSGHMYFDVKDDRNVLSCTTWKGQIPGLSVMPEEGLEVVVTGRLTAYGAQSRYNMNVDDVAVAGKGALMALLEKRKAMLQAEGLFAQERKQPLPYLPEIIGVVTSPTGAVIRDILHRLRDRFPRKVLIWPVAVQGNSSAAEVARAIAGFNAMTPGGALPRPDLLIVARGGGSIEDLWGFNEEIVARAAAASDIPLISAVGHETDTTLIDFVADRRAPTPTAAAELAVPVRLELLAWVEGQGGRLTRSLTQGLMQRGQRLRDLSRALPRADTLLDNARQRLDVTGERLPAALNRTVQLRRVKLSDAAGALRPSVLTRPLGEHRRRLQDRSVQLGGALGRMTAQKRAALHSADRLSVAPIQRDLSRKRQAFEGLGARLSVAGQRQITGWASRIEGLDRLLDTMGHTATLRRGYALVRGDGSLVTTADAAAKAGALEIEFADGRLNVGQGTAETAVPLAAKPQKPKPKAAKKSDGPEGQGSLF